MIDDARCSAAIQNGLRHLRRMWRGQPRAPIGGRRPSRSTMGDWAGQVFVEGEIPFSLNGGFWPRNVGNALSFSRPMFIGKVVDRLLIPSGAKNLVRQAVRV